ncbi:GNAT family N-acetyltransferase [Halococcus sp. IIIV-5B]|uniref:GNAT family N-acetyltransferase n=1 Tax=Halococcus sp. IIIV-5B TaxID=2321230 RepID=UPI000E747827|nr:GNAT family protein [Halococcus sp. IIIV-5B]RJT07432.1 N-acetyltransferase [Halococcus sp. IIIV-5B]
MSRPTFINCDRLDLKPAEEEDIGFLQEGVNHPQVRRYISVFRTPYNEERYRDELWSRGNDDPSLLAIPNEGEFEGEPVGTVSLSPVIKDDGYANFGVWFHPNAWGNGYALEASAYLIEYGFRDLRLHRISATTMASNEASKTLCERLGFVHEGTARETQFADGKYVNVERYGLLIDEWNEPEKILNK